ncbi:MAG: DUF5606 domain-containing protein [Flavobacteriaceae bacterium]
MEKIIAVAGRTGLFEIQTQTRVGVIAHSLVDGKRIVTQSTDQISVLSDIQIYTYSGEVPLGEVLLKIGEKELSGVAMVSPKADQDTLKSFFQEVIPDYDLERVYASDIKKIIQWYLLLKDKERLQIPVNKAIQSSENND